MIRTKAKVTGAWCSKASWDSKGCWVALLLEGRDDETPCHDCVDLHGSGLSSSSRSYGSKLYGET